MKDHWIYADFETYDINFKNFFENEIKSLPNELLPLAGYYLKERLYIINEKDVKFDILIGRPVPYLAYWLSDAFELIERKTIDLLALSLIYASILVSLRDDLSDGRICRDNKDFDENHYVALISFYYSKYINTFKQILPADSNIWHILTEAQLRWSNYEMWAFSFRRSEGFSPLSADFLGKTSSYLVAITFPTLAAICILTDRKSKLNKIEKFLEYYCMGWKIADDLKDWKKDLTVSHFNHSVIIYEVLNTKSGDNTINQKTIESMFLHKPFIDSIYDKIVECYTYSKNQIIDLKSRYLEEFIDSQIRYFTLEKETLIQNSQLLSERLLKVLNKIDTSPKHHN